MIKIKFILIFIFLAFFNSFGQVDSVGHFTPPIIQIDNHIPSSQPTSTIYSFIEKSIPIFGVLIGFLLGILKEYISKRREVKYNGQGWLEAFIQLEEPLINQIQEIKKFITNNPVDTYVLTDFSLNEALEGNEFSDYDQRHLTKYLKRRKGVKTKESIKLSGNLKAYSRIIKSHFGNLTSYFSLIKENTAPHFQEFSSTLSLFRKIEADYVAEIINSDSTAIQKEIAEKLMVLTKSEIAPSITDDVPIDVFKFSTNFIRPFFEIAYEDRDHPKLKEAVNVLSQCDHAIMAIKMERKYLITKLEKTKIILEKNLEKISKLIEKI